MKNSEIIRWIATAWALLLAIVIGCYAYRAFKRGIVTMFGRNRSIEYSKKTTPISYWMVLSIYIILTLGLTSIVIFRLLRLFIQ